MKLFSTLAAIGIAATAVSAPAIAQHRTVERVDGPMKILPHHHRKICQVKYVEHHRVRKCVYR